MKFSTWRKSSYSDSGSAQCVEVAPAADAVGVRDTKNHDAGHLEVSPATWKTFVRSVRR